MESSLVPLLLGQLVGVIYALFNLQAAAPFVAAVIVLRLTPGGPPGGDSEQALTLEPPG